ncbi:glycogen synthase GlgA [endosymbiont of Ridgeia piscesae]|jgi:starch synthase|uniref:Glycogen synthase n=1 Tax=endosymbiont of Ridgeia piscesae TaxID=54398 RepID=A0A0T5Z5P8_9GAMM|nr:glycogen synthase GlgA [endosymbiont of Ridgeia piscesae]KRT55500.1 glycogen/starch synthase, ADP-glucose type [endosymbiont of Ridgeia piscesae]KRT58234.1 starch synthase [endosymbiont of Ridgeia piscesae]
MAEVTKQNTAPPLNILFVVSEAVPLIKTGGLADVAGSLPAALRSLGHDCRLVLPAFPEALRHTQQIETISQLRLFGYNEPVNLLYGHCGEHQLPVYLVDAPHFFNREGNPYLSPTGDTWADNADRFALFCRAAVEIAVDRAGGNWRPDLVHAHDWQAGLVPALLSVETNRPASVFTIHNLAYQGLFDQETFQRLGLPKSFWSPEGLEFYWQLSFIKGGIAYADRITTVSPTYSQEIQTPEYGYGLEGLLQHRRHHFSGILNGIDYHAWDPENDPAIAEPFNADHFTHKRLNKLALQRELGLPEDEHIQLFGYIGRLVEQKGVDLILQVLPGIIDSGAQVVFLGSGNPDLEQALKKISNKYHSRVGVRIGYDEGLAHRIEAGCDCFLMPSRFEPCGLNQIYSLRYGTVPIVRRTGGLADTVVDVSPATLANGTANGFVFDQANGSSLWQAVERAIEFYQRGEVEWCILATSGMKQDLSWENSAAHYVDLYRQTLVR